jgi:hypothetical protein
MDVRGENASLSLTIFKGFQFQKGVKLFLRNKHSKKFFVELKTLSWFLKFPHVASVLSIQNLFISISKQKIVKEEGGSVDSTLAHLPTAFSCIIVLYVIEI